jgi:FkbM family methyltransferase
MNLIKKIFTILTGNSVLQYLLNKNINYSLKLMGIGIGADVQSSGEFSIVNKLKQLNKPNLCIFDVGANIGNFSEMILSSFNIPEFVSIHCFEPSKKTFALLSTNLGKVKNVYLNNFGFGKEKGEFNLYYDKEGSGLASLTKRKLDHFNIEFTESEKVDIDTIDNYCVKNNIQNIDLLKIDVEGNELDVLTGAKQMFENNKIKMVSFEFGGCNIDTRTYFQDFYYFFAEKNFRIFRITPSGFLYLIETYNEYLEQFSTTNFLAIYNSQVE